MFRLNFGLFRMALDAHQNVLIFLLLVINLTSLGEAEGLAHADLLWLGKSFTAWIVLAILAIGPTIGGYGLYIVSLGYLPASVANLIATLEPVFTAILAYMLLSERLSGLQLLGSALVAASIVLLRFQEGRVTWAS